MGGRARRWIQVAVGDALGHYVMISTGQVYLVREGCPKPAREADYDGPVMARPDHDTDGPQWDYGSGKRQCEDLVCADRMGATRVRIPVVNGPRDNQRRMESYLWRLVDGAEVLLPDGGETPMRHVYSEDVARAVAAMLGDARTHGQARVIAGHGVPRPRVPGGGLGGRGRGRGVAAHHPPRARRRARRGGALPQRHGAGPLPRRILRGARGRRAG
jgi:nucleoside-diphosphate-sugar epimerase